MSGPYFEVPAGTRMSGCRSCDHPVYWITTAKGKKMPVDCEADEQCVVPTATEPGTGVSHFATCDEADRWRKPRR